MFSATQVHEERKFWASIITSDVDGVRLHAELRIVSDPERTSYVPTDHQASPFAC